MADSFVERLLDLRQLTGQRSAFLLGPRQTGKTAWIRHTFADQVMFVDLLDKERFFALSSRPSALREEILARPDRDELIVIDEVQKLPSLLDEIHLLIERHQRRFLLTGSSARKLRQEGVNLLGGRARQHYLHPLTFGELGEERFDLLRALNRGLLPAIYFSANPRADQRAYAGTYLEQEIASEAKVRNIEAFSRFLPILAANNGQIINQTNISNDAGIGRKIVHEYFQIVKDTLLGYELPCWARTRQRKALATPKFYLFDVGIARALRDLPVLKPKSPDFGEAFEHYIFHELKTYVDYRRPDASLAYWRSTSGFEVDFILGSDTAIEVKGKERIAKADLKGLEALMEEHLLRRYLVVSLENVARTLDNGIEILPWRQFLRELWADTLLAPEEAMP